MHTHEHIHISRHMYIYIHVFIYTYINIYVTFVPNPTVFSKSTLQTDIRTTCEHLYTYTCGACIHGLSTNIYVCMGLVQIYMYACITFIYVQKYARVYVYMYICTRPDGTFHCALYKLYGHASVHLLHEYICTHTHVMHEYMHIHTSPTSCPSVYYRQKYVCACVHL